jgi:hypothetical protein
MQPSQAEIDKIKKHVYPLFSPGAEVLILPTPSSALAGDYFCIIGGGRHGRTHGINKAAVEAAVERHGWEVATCRPCMVAWDMPPTLHRVGTEEYIVINEQS